MAPNIPLRSRRQLILDTLTFPLRALTLFYQDRWGLSSLATDRFDFAAREIRGTCLDVGCGPGNRFIRHHLGGNGVGLDVFAYEGLDEQEIVKDLTSFPFPEASFASVTFIASLNHVPRQARDLELAEAYRVLKPKGNVIITMGNSLAEVLVHQLVACYDRLLKTSLDLDSQRGMSADEDFYLSRREIVDRLSKAGFQQLQRKPLWTQWGLNFIYSGEKPAASVPKGRQLLAWTLP